MKLRFILLVVAVVSLGACRMENEVRWTTDEPFLVSALTAANDFLQGRGEPIWRDDASPNTRVVIDENFAERFPSTGVIAVPTDKPRCLGRFCESEEQRHTLIINPTTLFVWPESLWTVTLAHGFKLALGYGHVGTCPHLMNRFIGCQPRSLAECTEETC